MSKAVTGMTWKLLSNATMPMGTGIKDDQWRKRSPCLGILEDSNDRINNSILPKRWKRATETSENNEPYRGRGRRYECPTQIRGTQLTNIELPIVGTNKGKRKNGGDTRFHTHNPRL